MAAQDVFIKDANDEWQSVVGPEGPAGEIGPEGPPSTEPGPEGPPGPDGADGPQGEIGPEGPEGPAGTSVNIVGSVPTRADLDTIIPDDFGDGYIVETPPPGDLWVWPTGATDPTTDWENVGQIVGPAGETGEPGPKGDTGEAGPIGETGPKGDQGEPGTPGETGDTGDAGRSVTVFQQTEEPPAADSVAGDVWIIPEPDPGP